MKYALLLFILIYVDGCNSKKGFTESLNGNWKIVSIENETIKNKENTNFIINTAEKSLAATIGCNNHMGDFDITNGKIQIDNVFATEKYCPDLADIEKKLWTNLPIITGYKLKGDRLTLINLEGNVAMTLVR